eukprot:gene8711-17998_t
MALYASQYQVEITVYIFNFKRNSRVKVNTAILCQENKAANSKTINSMDTDQVNPSQGQKLHLEEISELIVTTIIEKFFYFKSVLLKGDINEMFQLLKSGDPIVIGIIFWTTISAGVLIYLLTSYNETSSPPTKDNLEEEKEKIVLRDFTVDQLRDFDGSKNTTVYIAIKGEVYDVSKSSDLYGVEGAYHCFSGRDATRALAKLSFDESELSNPRYDDLGPFERDSLEGWVEKFKYYRAYPIVGRVSSPPASKDFKRSELSVYNGTQEVPTGRIDAPIYIAINGKVLDVSYGGKEHYGADGGYNLFAGKDASRALAKMSFKDEDVNNTDLSDLTETQLKTLNDWEKKFIEVRKYPILEKRELSHCKEIADNVAKLSLSLSF